VCIVLSLDLFVHCYSWSAANNDGTKPRRPGVGSIHYEVCQWRRWYVLFHV